MGEDCLLMKLRHPGLIRFLALIATWLLRLWTRTLCFRLYTEDGQPHPPNHRKHRYLYAVWHEAIVGVAVWHEAVPIGASEYSTRFQWLVSQHLDGELVARIVGHFRAGTVRGSTTRGGAQALLELMRQSEGHVGVIPDGPRGPRRQVQVGLIFLAALTGLPIVPCGMGFGRAWRLRSWDRFALPCPGSAVDCVVGTPIHVPRSLNRGALERYRQLVESEMLRLTELAEQRATRKHSPRIDMTVSSGTIADRSAA
jgi:lysophospholipid acyltransferase (LPLAT)-like uncharacterized protein